MAFMTKTNFGYSVLNGGIAIGAGSLAVTGGHGVRFPSAGNFPCVIWEAAYLNPQLDTTRELVLCTARSTDTLTITRAQESTTAKAWDSGSKVAMVISAAFITQIETEIGLKAVASSLTDVTMTGTVIKKNSDDSAIYLSGGSAWNAGGRIIHYGENHASYPNQIHYHGVHRFLDASGNWGRGIAVEDWIDFTPAAGWTGQTQCSYTKDPFGFVHLKGFIGLSGSYNSLIYNNLPYGYRPAQTVLFPNAGGPSGYWRYLSISTGGVITVSDYVTDELVFLDGITFKAA